MPHFLREEIDVLFSLSNAHKIVIQPIEPAVSSFCLPLDERNKLSLRQANTLFWLITRTTRYFSELRQRAVSGIGRLRVSSAFFSMPCFSGLQSLPFLLLALCYSHRLAMDLIISLAHIYSVTSLYVTDATIRLSFSLI